MSLAALVDIAPRAALNSTDYPATVPNVQLQEQDNPSARCQNWYFRFPLRGGLTYSASDTLRASCGSPERRPDSVGSPLRRWAKQSNVSSSFCPRLYIARTDYSQKARSEHERPPPTSHY